MNYLLDANACIALINRTSTRAREKLNRETLLGNKVFLSSVVNHELWFGVAKSQRAQANTIALLNFIDQGFETLQFSNGDAETAGKIRAVLKAAGTPIGAYDTLIAGQALARGLTLVTANTGEFSRVNGLSLVDWTI
jgi:tRNA(fMet)-specific endonuclease VapC